MGAKDNTEQDIMQKAFKVKECLSRPYHHKDPFMYWFYICQLQNKHHIQRYDFTFISTNIQYLCSSKKFIHNLHIYYLILDEKCYDIVSILVLQMRKLMFIGKRDWL